MKVRFKFLAGCQIRSDDPRIMSRKLNTPVFAFQQLTYRLICLFHGCFALFVPQSVPYFLVEPLGHVTDVIGLVQTCHDDGFRADRDNWVSHRPDSRQAFAAPRPDPPSTPSACDSLILPVSVWTAPCGRCPSRRFPRLPPSSARGHQ